MAHLRRRRCSPPQEDDRLGPGLALPQRHARLVLRQQDPGTGYLAIYEVGSTRTANKWTVAVFDTGADVTLCSEDFAIANGLTYGGHRVPLHTADGGNTTTLGALDKLLEFVLAARTPYACSAVAPVQVVQNAGHLYDLIISMEIIAQWSAHVDIVNATLVYMPEHWLGGDSDIICDLPMNVRGRKPYPDNREVRLVRPKVPQHWRAAVHTATAAAIA
jgi:hypothetical protein